MESGAEADVRNARTVLDSLADLESLFPGVGTSLLPTAERESAEEVLASERFHERLPELRGVIRKAVDRTRERYETERAAYAEALKNALARLQADPNWTKLIDEDREEIAGRLVCELPETAEDGDPVQLLRTLLVRKQGLPALLEELRREIKHRLPPEPEPWAKVKEGSGEPENVEIVAAEELVQPALIASSTDLDSWLAAIRENLAALLKAGKCIKIMGRERGASKWTKKL